jgi:hypothetical protein
MRFRLMPARVSAAATAVLLVLAPATPAAATMPPTWVEAPCATGALTEYAGSVDEQGLSHVSVAGWIQPCEDEPSATFAVMVYDSAAGSPLLQETAEGWTGYYPYKSASEPTPFRFDLGFRAPSPVRAACVARGMRAPVACVSVDQSGTGAPVVAPIPTDDPRIVPATRIVIGAPDIVVVCGSCV